MRRECSSCRVIEDKGAFTLGGQSQPSGLQFRLGADGLRVWHVKQNALQVQQANLRAFGPRRLRSRGGVRSMSQPAISCTKSSITELMIKQKQL